MNTPILLQIPEACHQDWNKMTEAAKGRFCGSCQKTVVDFTTMSDQQVLNFFNDKAGQDTCGRLTEKQLAQSYQELPKPKSSWYKWAVAFIASGMFGSLKIHAQAKPDTTLQCTKDKKVKGEVKQQADPLGLVPKPKEPVRIMLGGVRTSPAASPVIVIKGTVTDENNEPVAFPSVIMKATGRGVAADERGNFSLPVQSAFGEQKIVISAVGYTTHEIGVTADDILAMQLSGDSMNIQLKSIRLQPVEFSGSLLTSILRGSVGGIMVVPKVSKKDTIVTVTRKLFSLPAFRISPSPARSGGNVQIRLKKPGTYYVELLDLNSRLISRNTSEVISADMPIDFPIPFSAAAGNYFIRVTDTKGGKGMVEKLMVY